MIFRRATKRDIEAIVAMLADDNLGAKREHFTTPLSHEYLQAFKNITNDPNQELIVVVNEQEEVIGTLQLSFIQYLTYRGGIRAQIEAVRVRKDHRGKSLGEKILNWAIERAKEKEAHVLQLTTDKKRPNALKFYLKLGFIDSHEGMKMHL